MNSRPWRTNAFALIDAFGRQQSLVPEDIRTLLSFARKLEIDPLDILATKDHVGEYHCRIGPSATVAGRVLACGYRIDVPHRSVEVISFSLTPGCDRRGRSAFQAPIATRVLAS